MRSAAHPGTRDDFHPLRHRAGSLRSGLAPLLLVVALGTVWLPRRPATEDSSAGTGWILLCLLLVGAAWVVGLVRETAWRVTLPVPRVAVQLVLVAPVLVLILAGSVQAFLIPGVGAAPAPALGLTAGILSLQAGNPGHPHTWHRVTVALLAAGTLLTAWFLLRAASLEIDSEWGGLIVLLVASPVGWLPVAATWCLIGVAARSTPEWAALRLLGWVLLGLILLPGVWSPFSVPGAALVLAAAFAAGAPGVPTLAGFAAHPADRRRQWAAGVAVHWAMAGLVLLCCGLIMVVLFADEGLVPRLFSLPVYGAGVLGCALVCRVLLGRGSARTQRSVTVLAACFVVGFAVVWGTAVMTADDMSVTMFLMPLGLPAPVVLLTMLTVMVRHGAGAATGASVGH